MQLPIRSHDIDIDRSVSSLLQAVALPIPYRTLQLTWAALTHYSNYMPA